VRKKRKATKLSFGLRDLPEKKQLIGVIFPHFLMYLGVHLEYK